VGPGIDSESNIGSFLIENGSRAMTRVGLGRAQGSDLAGIGRADGSPRAWVLDAFPSLMDHEEASDSSYSLLRNISDRFQARFLRLRYPTFRIDNTPFGRLFPIILTRNVKEANS